MLFNQGRLSKKSPAHPNYAGSFSKGGPGGIFKKEGGRTLCPPAFLVSYLIRG